MITIDLKALKAVSRFVADKDVRYYLNGVYVESSPLETRLVATDGHALAVHRSEAKDKNEGSHALIIPIEAVNAVLRIKRLKGIHDSAAMTPVSGTEWRLSVAGQTVVFTPVDAKYPDYRRVIPTTLSDKTAHYEPELMLQCKKADADFCDSKHPIPVIRPVQNGKGPALVTFGHCSNMVAVVMPLVPHKDYLPPTASDAAWAREPLPHPETAPESALV